MPKLPYMKFYPGDYLADTRQLGIEEHGGYLMLIMHLWCMGGRVQLDPRKLAMVTGCPQRRWSKIWAGIEGYFDIEKDVDGIEWISQRRVSESIEKGLQIVTSKRDAANTKWSRFSEPSALKKKETADAYASKKPRKKNAYAYIARAKGFASAGKAAGAPSGAGLLARLMGAIGPGGFNPSSMVEALGEEGAQELADRFGIETLVAVIAERTAKPRKKPMRSLQALIPDFERAALSKPKPQPQRELPMPRIPSEPQHAALANAIIDQLGLAWFTSWLNDAQWRDGELRPATPFKAERVRMAAGRILSAHGYRVTEHA